MTQQEEFIEKIAPLHQKYAKKYGFKIVSAGIAQACLESGYGTGVYNDNRNKVRNPYTGEWRHNYFGLKYRPNRVNCNCGYFSSSGTEQLADGSYIPTTTDWYKFETLEKGIEGYYQFINISNYAKVKEAKDPLTYLQEIKNAGYATSLDYVKNVYAVVQKWNLTKYDTIEKEENTNTNNNNINIIKQVNLHNTTVKPNRKIEFIVLHYTAGTSSSQGSAKGVASYFSRTPNQASADFIVDDNDIVQYNPDPDNYYCWAVGGKQYPTKSNSLSAKYYGICTNKNSISIEMCSRKKNITTLNASDDDWYLTDSTVNNAIILTKYLMKKYNINANHVIMHNMVNGKWCPQPWAKNEAALSGWYDFLKKIGAAIQPTQSLIPEPAPAKVPYIVRIVADNLNIRSGPGISYSIVGTIRDRGLYTIIDEENGWGKLKSGAGWISLKYTTPKN